MRELLDDIDRWRAAGKRVAVARVVDIEGSGPREPGAAMAVNDDGEVAGSVSGGCVEGAVVTEALAILPASAEPRHRHVRLQRRRGVRRRPHVRRHDPAVHRTARLVSRLVTHATTNSCRERIRAEQPVALATVVDGPHVGAKLLVTPDRRARRRSLGHPELDRIVARDALAELEAGRSGVRHYGPEGQTTPEDLVDTPTVSVFVESWAPPPQMWIFGAVDFTAALAKVAKVLGYRVTVCDAREIFATRRRFPMADEVIVSWPGAGVRPSAAHTLGPARRGVHPHPRPEVRRARGAGRAGHHGRLHRRDGQPQDARQADGAPGRGRRRSSPSSSTG